MTREPTIGKTWVEENIIIEVVEWGAYAKEVTYVSGIRALNQQNEIEIF